MNLQTFFQEEPRVALGFSGGVDSSYLLYAALHYGAEVKAYYIKTDFQPDFEYRDAMRLAEQLGAKVQVLELDISAYNDVTANPSERCYYCKRALFGTLAKQAHADGYPTLIDGTNASDDATDRPGMRALQELSVRSPLRECGLTKAQIRTLSKEAGLFTWDKPSYACLATRVPTGQPIHPALLKKIERAEDQLFSLGFTDFRVRVIGENIARIQLPLAQWPAFLEQKEEVQARLASDFPTVLLDLQHR